MKASTKIRLPFLVATSMAFGLAAIPVHAANEVRPPGAAPANQTSVAQLNEEGAALYAARDYRRAIEKFIQAYAIDTDPNLLFNIARCYEELGEVDAAIEKYETFLKTPGADTRGRQRARESIVSLREARDGTGARSEAPRPSAPSHAPVAEPPQAAVDNDSAEGSSSALPWLTLGGSVLFAAAGTAFYVLGSNDHAQVTDAEGYRDPTSVSNMTRREADDLVSSGDTKKLVGGISLGVSGALAATYVVLLIAGDDESPPEAEPNLGFSLSPSPDGAAVSVQGSF
jgi:tetratricopeptide (TPR) repeat protein